ncbi:hypothetical protein [Vibrio fortis]|uniref:hypothetical protein n=1 Tax=Vibrio fortis TaxID=212667 RepID=UPI0021C34784|nr:hypothetical protein [Vibrio fortis]
MKTLKIPEKMSFGQAKKYIYETYHFNQDLSISGIERINSYKCNDIVKLLAKMRTTTPQTVIENVRNTGEIPPLDVRPLIGTYQASGFDNIRTVDPTTGSGPTIQGDALLVASDYQDKFNSSVTNLLNTVQKPELDSLHTAIIKLFASFDSYFNYKSQQFNQGKAPGDQLKDTGSNIVGLEDKIKTWIPLLSDGSSINTRGKEYASLLALKAIRNDEAIHSKQATPTISLNDFLTAVNQILDVYTLFYEIHKIIDKRAPQQIIRASFIPDVILTS